MSIDPVTQSSDLVGTPVPDWSHATFNGIGPEAKHPIERWTRPKPAEDRRAEPKSGGHPATVLVVLYPEPEPLVGCALPRHVDPAAAAALYRSALARSAREADRTIAVVHDLGPAPLPLMAFGGEPTRPDALRSVGLDVRDLDEVCVVTPTAELLASFATELAEHVPQGGRFVLAGRAPDMALLAPALLRLGRACTSHPVASAPPRDWGAYAQLRLIP